MVKMASRLTFGTSITDWQQRIDVERMRRERAEKARAVLRARGIPGLLAAGAPNTRYLVGLRGPEFAPQLWYVLFFAEGDPVVFHHAGWIEDYPSQVPWIAQWRLARAWLPGAGPEAGDAEAKLFAKGVVDELHAHGLQQEQLPAAGVAPRPNTPRAHAAASRAAADVTLPGIPAASGCGTNLFPMTVSVFSIP